jgi:large subunit ribosomal protein L25
MSTAATLSYPAEPRSQTGSKAAAKLRAAGRVPVTVTKPGQPSQLLSLDLKSANHLAAHVVHLLKLEVKGGATLTALRAEIVTDCLTDHIQHIDLIEVDEKSEIKVDVAIRPDARECPGVKAGGIVEQRLRKLRVQCKANAIPDVLELDLGDVQITETVFASKVKLPAGVRLAVSPTQPILTVVIPREMLKAEEKAAATPAADGATPAAAGAAGEAKPGDAKAAAGAAGDAKAGDAKAADAKPGAKPAGDAKKK